MRQERVKFVVSPAYQLDDHQIGRRVMIMIMMLVALAAMVARCPASY
jgi:tetrahydromethanopterin S-methyltransferase subunit G